MGLILPELFHSPRNVSYELSLLLRPAQRSQDEWEKRSMTSIFFPIHLEIFELVSITEREKNMAPVETGAILDSVIVAEN